VTPIKETCYEQTGTSLGAISFKIVPLLYWQELPR
jgi:hypothetical protein